MVPEMATKITMTAAATAVPMMAPRRPPCPSAMTAAPPHSKKLVMTSGTYKTPKTLVVFTIRIMAVELIMAMIKPIKTAFGR